MKATIRNDVPTSRVRNTDIPKVRIAQTGILTRWSEIQAGTPIGLLLTLTYATLVSIPTVFKGKVPIVNIKTD